MKKSLSLLFSVMLVLVLALTGCSSKSSSDGKNNGAKSSAKSMLETVKQRGTLKAGVNDALPGFGYIGSDGKNTGFDVDIARAIAAGVLGDANKIEFRPLSATERFTAVQSKEVDVLVRNTTWTTNRDAEVGLSFAPVTFYDGQGIMVPKDSGIKTLKDLEGKTIGVETGTTTELNLADQMKAAGVNYKAQTFDNADAVIAAYESGSIDAWTTDKSGLVSRQSTLKNPDSHVILDATLSKEPLAAAVLDNDEKWKDAVSWIVYALIQAEEFGITSKNVDEFKNSDNPEIQRLLGEKDNNLGEQLGLSNDFAYQVIKQVGNYGEIYERNLGPDTPFKLKRGQNALYKDGGLLYSIPFR
ncbi:transporter substrate-binding domain-containing protein [Niallia sp. 03133]|uniref:transporter substrate-binding domain-containing protein n=1 Tax=Niallia sp. 03133 TaxID=3458060 RepID=UPI00404516C5